MDGPEERKTLPQRRREETHQHILGAAYQVFARRGYEAATVDEIAAECGISKGALYHHFSSKEDLFATLIRTRYELPAFTAISAWPEERPFDVGELVSLGMRAVWDRIRREPAWFRLLEESYVQAGRNEAIAEIMSAVRRGNRHVAESILRQGQERGNVRRDLDVESMAVVMTAISDGAVSAYFVDENAFDVERFLDVAVDTIARMLRP